MNIFDKIMGNKNIPMTEYYLTHTLKETSDKYGVPVPSINASFKKQYGSSKREYLSKRKVNTTVFIEDREVDIARYVEENSAADASLEFNISIEAAKASYMKVNGKRVGSRRVPFGSSKQAKASKYYLTHTRQETADEFGIKISNVSMFFKREYGMSKSDYLRIQKGISNSRRKIAEHYLDHTSKETSHVFDRNVGTIGYITKEVFGDTKTNILLNNQGGVIL